MGKTIFWIEDDAYIIGDLVRPLELAGHEVIIITKPEDVLDRMEEIGKSDLVLLDMLMSSKDPATGFTRYPGLDILEAMRDKHKSVPVLVLSVVIRPEIHERLEELGINGLIKKPVLPSELKEAVEDILSKTD